MSVNMDMDGTGTDYSDFQVQQVAIEQQLQPSGQGARTFDKFTVEPLEGVGGLSTNEVAELVYLEVQAGIEYDTEVDDQNVGSQTEFRGVVGVNLPATGSTFTTRTNVRVDTENIETQNATNNNRGGTATDNARLAHFQTFSGVPFDTGGGPGGSGVTVGYRAEFSYRDLTNRGPVMDQNDDITPVTAMIADDLIISPTGNLRLHMVWDVAETEDSGRRFAVPE